MFTTLKAEGLSNKVIDITGLLDSGSEVNILREDIAEAIKVEYCKNGGVLRAANGTVLQSQVGYVNIWSNKIGNFETIKFYILINTNCPRFGQIFHHFSGVYGAHTRHDHIARFLSRLAWPQPLGINHLA